MNDKKLISDVFLDRSVFYACKSAGNIEVSERPRRGHDLSVHSRITAIADAVCKADSGLFSVTSVRNMPPATYTS